MRLSGRVKYARPRVHTASPQGRPAAACAFEARTRAFFAHPHPIRLARTGRSFLFVCEERLHVKFDQLGLSATLLMTLEREGYHTPTPIQAQAIPHLLQRHDLLGIAQTGTGKTAAFALPILQHLLSDRRTPEPRHVRTLILSPTRELASQIADSFKTYGKGMGLHVATVYGGVKYGPQYKALAQGVDVLVATPGRLIDHLEQKTVNLGTVEFFVLDEADQMLDLGFVKPIRQIASRLPKKRQNLFFSATMPKEIGALAAELLTEPKRVEVTPEATTAERVEQSVVFVEAQRKRALLSELYADESLARTLVFTRTKRSADRVAAYLQAGGIEAAAIHGDKNQSQRERALQAFRAGKLRALVATDIAARGIDVDGVSHVINFELPNVPEAYVHRIGRTARAGASGIAMTLCSDDERRLLKDIERVTRQRIPSFDRRKDQGLKLLDEAILASGNTEKPATPERLPEHRKKGDPRPGRTPRHIDGDAEFVHKRQRNRHAGKDLGQKDRARERQNGARAGGDNARPERYDPMKAERGPMASTTPIAFKGADKPARKFGQDPFKAAEPREDKRPFDRKRDDRPHDRPRSDAREARTDDRSGAKPAGKPFGKRFGKPGGKPGFKGGKAGFGGQNRAHASEAPRPRHEGEQFKRKAKS